MGSVFKQTGKSLFGLVSGGLGGNQSCRVEVVFTHPDETPVETITLKGGPKQPEEELPLYSDSSDSRICGQLQAPAERLRRVFGVLRARVLHIGTKVEHQGIRAQLIGVIELANAGVKYHEFLSLSRELAPSGELRGPDTYPFEFTHADLTLDSYRGNTVRLRYYIKVTLARSIGGQSAEFPFWVQNPCRELPAAEPIKLEVGIEDCLHLEFSFSSSAYGVTDCVLGKIDFRLVKINLKKMELEVRRKEITGAGSKVQSDMQTLYKYEIMDGAPVRGESVPVRLFLGPLELSPTYLNVNNKFSVKYFLNLVLVDQEDRRYFKQHEVTLLRRPPMAET